MLPQRLESGIEYGHTDIDRVNQSTGHGLAPLEVLTLGRSSDPFVGQLPESSLEVDHPGTHHGASTHNLGDPDVVSSSRRSDNG